MGGPGLDLLESWHGVAMRRRMILYLAAGLATSLAGCMTALNTMYYTPTEGGKEIYGGVKLDAELFKEARAKDAPTLFGCTGPVARIGTVTLATMDLPLSAVGDTLTLPITMKAAFDRAIDELVDRNPEHVEEWRRKWFTPDKAAQQQPPPTATSGQTNSPTP